MGREIIDAKPSSAWQFRKKGKSVDDNRHENYFVSLSCGSVREGNVELWIGLIADRKDFGWILPLKTWNISANDCFLTKNIFADWIDNQIFNNEADEKLTYKHT